MRPLSLALASALIWAAAAAAQPEKNPTFVRIKAHLDAVPAIDTHDHLWPFDKLPGYVETESGKGMNLAGLWRNSYLTRVKQITPWTAGGKFADWWANAKHDFDDVHAVSFYRYQATAIKDLYGVDFDQITDDQAADLNRRIYRIYLNKDWLIDVIIKPANIELMFNDPYCARFDFKTDYAFSVIVLNVTTLTRGFNPTEFKSKDDSPYEFAKAQSLPTNTLDDYLAVVDKLFEFAKGKGAVCLKTTLAYERGLDFANETKERGANSFGKPRGQLPPAEVKEFEDFIMWRLVELSAKHELPYQIHSGDARIQGSNPMNLVDLIDANPKTKFILFHGGYPWVSETGAIAM